jgi:hypothetical protein
VASASTGALNASPPSIDGGRKHSYYAELFLVSFAGLLLEIGYTRVISFKLFYYYTYFVIGLALLGIGAGAVLVTISSRLRRAATDTIMLWSLLLGAASIGIGYAVVAFTSLDTFAIWQYGTFDSVKNFGLLLVICLAVFASFIAVGVITASLFSRTPERINRLYFADLVGAGLAGATVISLVTSIGAPATILLAGLTLTIAALRVAARRRALPVAVVLAALLGACVVAPGLFPEQRLEAAKANFFPKVTIYSSWSPIFRLDVADIPKVGARFLYHDGLLGSAIYRWDGRLSTLSQFRFNQDVRSLPFSLSPTPPGRDLIIGAAGGKEVLASLSYHVRHIDAVELNPVTYSLVTDKYAGYDGHLAQKPGVHYVEGDGRSFLARSNQSYDVIWFPAPDSYSATSASTAGAFVLSESYLYTSNAIVDSFKHLAPNGILAVQFGEVNYAQRPNRTTRYVATARHALAELGIRDPSGHILVATSPSFATIGGATESTILVKASPFTPTEVNRFVSALATVPGSTLRYAPGIPGPNNSVRTIATSSSTELRDFYASYPYNVNPITDNGPFFWHFARFSTTLSNFTQSLKSSDRENTQGERVLLLLLFLSILLAAVFLLLPFLTIRDRWRAFNRKGRSATFFAAIGFGFFFFEITLIQRLVLFLGYPTYSLTVTIASLLIFVGIGALLSGRLRQPSNRALPILLAAITVLTVFYLFGLPPLTDALLSQPLAVRVPIAFVVLAPLGICLGMFMPLGLGAVARLSEFPREYVAWGWAVNGFASVVGSTLTTILAMSFGFGTVLVLALVSYIVALTALRGLWSGTTTTPVL